MQYLVFVGALIAFIGAIGYVRDTLRGDTKPNRMTWFLWTLAPFIGTAAAVVDGVGWAVLPVFMAGFGPFMVFVASFVNKNAYWKLDKFDYGCGFLSIMALVLWALTNEPLVAIFLAIVADAFAAIPTLVKAWQHPETESANIFAASFFAALTSFAAIQYWSMAEYAFPAYLVAIKALLVFFITRKRFLPTRSE